MLGALLTEPMQENWINPMPTSASSLLFYPTSCSTTGLRTNICTAEAVTVFGQLRSYKTSCNPYRFNYFYWSILIDDIAPPPCLPLIAQIGSIFLHSKLKLAVNRQSWTPFLGLAQVGGAFLFSVKKPESMLQYPRNGKAVNIQISTGRVITSYIGPLRLLWLSVQRNSPSAEAFGFWE